MRAGIEPAYPVLRTSAFLLGYRINAMITYKNCTYKDGESRNTQKQDKYVWYNHFMDEPNNLHTIPALQEIHIRDDIKLRPLQNSDAGSLLELLKADTSIRDKVTVASRFHTPDDVEAEVKRSNEDSGLIRYTLLKEDNVIGLVSLWRDEGYFGTPPQPDDYGFGYFLDPKERGKGLVTNSVQNLMYTVAKSLHVNQFVAFCEDNNTESIAVLTKLGFKPTEEVFPEPTHGWTERKYVKR